MIVSIASMLCAMLPVAPVQATCSPSSVVFAEGFDQGVLPPGWAANDWVFAQAPVCLAQCGSGFLATYWDAGCDCATTSGPGCKFGGDLVSPPIPLPAVGPGQALVLDFCFDGYLDTFTGDCNQLEVRDATGIQTFKLGENVVVPCPGPSFLPPFDLSAYAGRTIHLTFHAGSVDAEGVQRMTIDDVTVVLYDVDPPTDCNGNGQPDGCDVVNGTSPDCNGNGLPDSCDIAAGTSPDVDGNGIPDECQCANSHLYCTAGTNSLGKQAKLDWSGSTSITANDLVLEVSDGIPGQLGLFFMASTKVMTPFGPGFLCATDNVARLQPPIVLDASGAGAYAVDFLDPGPTSTILVGSEWNFQLWYRDPQALGPKFNLSDAAHLHFCP